MAEQSSSTSGRLDHAIVGGGVSGLYTAWRLLTDAQERGLPPPSIAIFEMGERVGGRLLTWLPLGTDGGLRAELGGMRFFEQQEMVWNLLDRLGFSDDKIEFYVTGPGLRMLLRGVSMPLDIPDATGRYELPDEERGKSAGAIVYEVIVEVLESPENKAVLEKRLGGKLPLTREDWDKIKPELTWLGRPLWDVGFWNLLSDVRSPETFAYISDSFGYYSLAGNWNAAEAMQSVSLDFNQNPDYKTLTEGYEALPRRLHEEVTKAGCRVELQTRLVSFDAGADGVSRLRLVGPRGAFEVDADHLFLAMPRRSLELLGPSAGFDIQGHPDLKRLIESVTPYPAFKLFLFYKTRWWDQFQIQHGRSISDLPIRQTYYFAPDSPSSLPVGLLMASYDDAQAVDYWQGLVPPEDEWERGKADLHRAVAELARVSGVEGADAVTFAPPPHLHKASDGMLRHAKDQLALLHKIPAGEIPDPIVGAFADWGFDPFGGGWNFWAPQVDVRDVMERIKAPLGKDRRVYVVGDAYSGSQGWVEGALTATELVLERYLSLPRPTWFPADYYLGW